MKVFGYILLGCLALAVIKFTVAALVLALLIFWAIAFIRHPQATSSLIVTLIVLGGIGSYPWASAVIIGTLAIFAIFSRRRG